MLYIEQDDFREDPPKDFFRLAPGREVRLRYAYFVKCTGVVKDPQSGQVVELRCTYDPATRGGNAPDGRKVKGTIHWVSADHAIDAEVRLYDHLFSKPNPDDVPEGQDYRANLNPNSLVVLTGCKLEPSLRTADAGQPTSLNGSATSAWTGIRPPASWSSTVPSRCGTHGPRWKRRRSDTPRFATLRRSVR